MKAIVRMLGLALVTALVLTACSTGTGSGRPASGGSGGTAESAAGKTVSGTGGLPSRIQETNLGSDVKDMLKGKRAQLVILSTGALITDEWINSMKLGFEQLGMTFGVSDAHLDTTLETQMFENAINEHVDVLIAWNSDLTSTANLLQEAENAGIYTIVLNIGSVQQTDAYVGPDWVAMSQMLANRVATDCLAKGKHQVAEILGLGSDAGSVLANDGFQSVFKQRGIQVVSNQPGQYDPSTARGIAATVLQQHPDLCAFVGNFDLMMEGAAQAVDQAGKKGQVAVYTTDSSAPTCTAIENGEITAAVDYGVHYMGPMIVGMSQYLLESGVKPGTTRTALFTPLRLIDKTNATDPNSCYTGRG
jgi:ribose transport system substrate-binding protein